MKKEHSYVILPEEYKFKTSNVNCKICSEKLEEKWMSSLLKWVWMDCVKLNFKDPEKDREETEVLHENCFNLLKNKINNNQQWEISIVE